MMVRLYGDTGVVMRGVVVRLACCTDGSGDDEPVWS